MPLSQLWDVLQTTRPRKRKPRPRERKPRPRERKPRTRERGSPGAPPPGCWLECAEGPQGGGWKPGVLQLTGPLCRPPRAGLKVHQCRENWPCTHQVHFSPLTSPWDVRAPVLTFPREPRSPRSHSRGSSERRTYSRLSGRPARPSPAANNRWWQSPERSLPTSLFFFLSKSS